VKIETRIEGRRGCGFRKPGGIYLVGPATGYPCCKLPFPLTVCPCCNQGIKPARSWTWVDVDKLLFPIENPQSAFIHNDHCNMNCPLSRPGIGKAGLLWIGGSFYKTPGEFLSEANEMGISRRIPSVPKEFVVGETWVLLAHRECIYEGPTTKEWVGEWKDTGQPTPNAHKNDWIPGIFSVFKPTAVEYVVKGGETQEELEALVKRGLTPVNVNPRKGYR
jgi:hypothetical protein